MTRIFLVVPALLAALAACEGTPEAPPEPAPRPQRHDGGDRRPNIVLLLADDLGYGDVSCFGSPSILTPAIDRIAAEGAKLTSFYVGSPTCTPSRAALMTGRYAIRSGLIRVLFPDDDCGLPSTEITIAEGLKDAGYRTGCIGKWHLGHHRPEYRPTHRGFDEFFGLMYSHDMERPLVPTPVPLSLWRGDEPTEHPVDLGTLTERFTEEAIGFIRDSRDEPFFLYLPYTAPHQPLVPSERFTGSSAKGVYGDVVEEIDWSVGRILECLREEGLEEDTLVIFTSDNGPVISRRLGADTGSSGVLNAGKGTTFEGGLRVPFAARWPGRIPAGHVTGEIASTLDLLPTFWALAGKPPPSDRPMDGQDVLHVLEGRPGPPHEPFFFYSGERLMGVRMGQWKLRAIPKRAKVELYDLGRDPGERYNVALDHIEVRDEMRAVMREFHSTVEPGPAYEAMGKSLERVKELYYGFDY